MAIDGNSPRKSQTSDSKPNESQPPGDTISDNESIESGPEFEQGEFLQTFRTSRKNEHLKLSNAEIASSEEYFQNFLIETVKRSDSRVYDIIKLHGKNVHFYKDEIIISQGETGDSLYILFSGCVSVLTSEGVLVRRVGEGEVFGEMSVLFDHPVSANIKAVTDVVVVTIPKKPIKALMKAFIKDIDVIDWCINRRYLPLGKYINSSRTYRRMTLSIFKGISLFQSWSEDMIKSLIVSMKDKLVFLYPENSYITMEDDPLVNIYVLVHGKVELTQGERCLTIVNVRNTDDPFVFTESTLHFDKQLSVVTIKALINCKIIQIRRDSVFDVLESYPMQLQELSTTGISFRSFKMKMGPIYKRYEVDLQIELLVRYMKQSSLYKETNFRELRSKILNCDFREYQLGQRIYLNKCMSTYESIIVVKGQLVQLKNTQAADHNAAIVAVYRGQDGDSVLLNDSAIYSRNVEEMDTQVDELLNSSDDQELQVSFKTGSVIVLNVSGGDSLVAKTRCLVLQIPTYTQEKCSNHSVCETAYVDEISESVMDLELV